MNNNEKCSVCISLNEDCNALTFAILLVKLLFSLLVIQTVTVSPNQLPTAHLLMKIVLVIIMKSSIYHILKIYNDIAVILGSSTVNKLKVSTSH